MTLVIMGLVGVAIIGAIMTAISSSSVHRNLANDDSIVKSALEAVKYNLELAPQGSSLFADCGANGNTAETLLTTWNSQMTANGLWPAIPTGIGSYRTWISGVECFTESPSTSSLDPACSASQTTPGGAVGGDVTKCFTNPDNTGIVQVTVSVLDESNLVTSLSTLVRNPQYESSYKVANF